MEEEKDVNKEDKEVTKQEVEQIVSAAITKAVGSAQQNAAQEVKGGTGAVEKAGGKENTTPTEITSETIEKMVEAAIAKALVPQEEQITSDQVEEMIATAVEKAIDPVLKSRGLPSNLNDSGVEKSADEQHYLHGIL